MLRVSYTGIMSPSELSPEEFVERAREELESKLREIREFMCSTFDKLEGELNSISERLRRAARERVVGRPPLDALVRALTDIRRLRRRAHTEVRRAMSAKRVEFREALWSVRRSAYDLSKGMSREQREEFLGEVSELIDEFSDRLDEVLDEWSDRLEYFTDMLNDLAEKARDYVREATSRFARRLAPPAGPKAFLDINEFLSSVDQFLRRLSESMERLFGEGYERGPTMVVSSIRLPKSDLELIDLLVEVGVFKSRSEGVAYFTHKGIEASREALEKLRSKLEEVRKLQEEIRKEAERALRGGAEETSQSEAEGSGGNGAA